MSWDRKARGAAGGYFYVSVRRTDKPHPVKLYLGRGAAGQEMAQFVGERKRSRETDRAALTAEKARTEDADSLSAELDEWARALANAWMALAGHKRHHRVWRIKNG